MRTETGGMFGHIRVQEILLWVARHKPNYFLALDDLRMEALNQLKISPAKDNGKTFSILEVHCITERETFSSDYTVLVSVLSIQDCKV